LNQWVEGVEQRAHKPPCPTCCCPRALMARIQLLPARDAAHLRAAKMRSVGWKRREPFLVPSPPTTAFVTAA
jgi:hypothetical protein